MNEAMTRIDAILHPSVEGSLATPPANPAAGESWLIASPGQDAWAGFDDNLATFSGSEWKLAQPRPGMRIFDKASRQYLHFDNGWWAASEPSAIEGGTQVDVEARAAIAELVDALRNIGVFPRT